MSTVLDLLDNVELEPLVLQLRPTVEITDDRFFEFCQRNDFWRIERTAQGDILITPPAGGETGSQNAELITQLRSWAKRDKSGVAFDSNTGFKLPNQATRSPDAAWVHRTRLKPLTKEQKEKFIPLCPDFVIELRSPSDRLSTLQDKMQE